MIARYFFAMSDAKSERSPPHPPLTSGMASLEAALARTCREVQESFDRARDGDDGDRDQAFNRAIALMGVSAKAGLALAKMRAEFSANFQVTKRTMAPGPDPALEYAKRAGDEAVWKRGRETFAREESAEVAEEEGEEEMGEGDPLSDSGGSNGPIL